MKMKKVLSLITVAVLLVGVVFSMSACKKNTASNGTGNDSSASGSAGGEFKVGLECSYAPFNWTQTDSSNGAVAIQGGSGYAGGYDIEIAKKIANGLGKKLVIVKTTWDGLAQAVQSGTIDAIIAGMSPTADRKTSIDFTDPYYRSNLVMIVKANSKYASAASIQDFTGAKITAQKNTFHYKVIDQIKGVKKGVALADFPALRVALQNGAIDGYVSERPEGISVTSVNKDLKMIQFANGKGFVASDADVAVAVGLKKGNSELVGKINKILAGISEQERTQLMDSAIKNQPAAK